MLITYEKNFDAWILRQRDKVVRAVKKIVWKKIAGLVLLELKALPRWIIAGLAALGIFLTIAALPMLFGWMKRNPITHSVWRVTKRVLLWTWGGLAHNPWPILIGMIAIVVIVFGTKMILLLLENRRKNQPSPKTSQSASQNQSNTTSQPAASSATASASTTATTSSGTTAAQKIEKAWDEIWDAVSWVSLGVVVLLLAGLFVGMLVNYPTWLHAFMGSGSFWALLLIGLLILLLSPVFKAAPKLWILAAVVLLVLISGFGFKFHDIWVEMHPKQPAPIAEVTVSPPAETKSQEEKPVIIPVRNFSAESIQIPRDTVSDLPPSP